MRYGNDRFNGNGGETEEEIPSREVPFENTMPHSHGKSVNDYHQYAIRLMRKCGDKGKLGPKFISIGKDLWRWNGSIWQPVTFDQYRPAAVMIQPEGSRTVIATNGIIEMMKNLTQRSPKEIKWQSAVRFEDQTRQAVMISLLNGDLRIPLTGVNSEFEMFEPCKEDYVTAQLPLAYDPEAKCPTFDYLLESALPDPKDRYALQCFVGYCLIPDHRFQCVLFCHGKPNSGKSLLIYHGIGGMFSGLTSHVSLENICRGGDELRLLEQSILNIGTEIDSRQLKDSAVFNQIACGETLDAALKYDKARQIDVNCKFIFIGNHYPHWERGSDAQARRIKMIHFSRDFTDKAKSGQYEKEVKAEAAGIFNWTIRGMLEIARLEQMPRGGEMSKVHAGQFKANNNPMGTFNQMFCTIKPGARVFTEDYRSAFKYWCDREGISIKIGSTQDEVSKLVRKVNPEIEIKQTRVKMRNKRFFSGMELNEEGKKLLKESIEPGDFDNV